MAKKQFSYNEAIEKIEEILLQIENDDLDVDELSEKVRKVTTLIKVCKQKLTQAESDVDKILEELK